MDSENLGTQLLKLELRMAGPRVIAQTVRPARMDDVEQMYVPRTRVAVLMSLQ